MKKIRSAVAWVLALVMVCSNVGYTRAADIAEKDSEQNVRAEAEADAGMEAKMAVSREPIYDEAGDTLRWLCENCLVVYAFVGIAGLA